MQMPNIKDDSLPTLRKRFSALFAIAKAKEFHLGEVQRELGDLRAKTNPDLLESERQANAMLTAENERLRSAADGLVQFFDEWELVLPPNTRAMLLPVVEAARGALK